MSCTCIIGMGLEANLLDVRCPEHGIDTVPIDPFQPVFIDGKNGTSFMMFCPRLQRDTAPTLTIEVSCDHGQMLGQLDYDSARAMRDRITSWLESNASE